MPIANCFLKNHVENNTPNKIASDWGNTIGVDEKDICINFVQNVIQAGHEYEALVNLYLPSLWTKNSIKKIQTELLNMLVKHLNITQDQIFIMTSIIQSGHVVERGEVVEWGKQ